MNGGRFYHKTPYNANSCGGLYQISFRLIAKNMPDVPKNIMDQYYPVTYMI